MAIKSVQEIMDSVRARVGESTDDDTLEFIADIQDTLTDYETRTKSGTDWKAKYEENDAAWRKKYKDRFFSGASQSQEDDDDEDEKPPVLTRFDQLFK